MIDIVPAPEVIIQPAGTVQVYDVAFGTAAILYTNPVMPGHTGEVPVIGPGVAGVAGLTVMETELLVAVVGVAQGAFDVSITFTTSPFTSVVVVNVALLIPAFAPFTCH